jgi:PRTRC genetic system protein C
MARLFIYDGREFPDPDPNVSVEDVRRQLSEYFPELTNADTREEKRGDDTVYTFSKRIGTKGAAAGARAKPATAPASRSSERAGAPASPALVARVLRGVPEKRLRVLELVGELLDEDGELDLDAVGAHQAEVNLALAEAKAHARHTAQAVDAVRRLVPRTVAAVPGGPDAPHAHAAA